MSLLDIMDLAMAQANRGIDVGEPRHVYILEPGLIRFGHAYESATLWNQRRPPI